MKSSLLTKTQTPYRIIKLQKKRQKSSDGHTTIDFPELSHKLILTYGNLQNWRNGSLDAGMTKEELAAAKESKAVYTNRTYIGDTEESNVRNLPLFPHAPQLNDIKQGVAGNCYMLAAVQTLVEKDPQTIKNMFYDLGDGNVIVRFYAAFGVHDGKYVRIDDEEELKNRQTSITTRPVYVKVRKHYTTGEEGSAYCIWMQLLEKAYAAAGFNLEDQDVNYGKIEGLLSEQHVIYEGIREREVPIKDLQKIRFSIQNLLVPNHEMRYTQDELGVLRKLKEEITTNKAVTINSKSGHSMTALDIKLHNGKWFVLIRDPFNKRSGRKTAPSV